VYVYNQNYFLQPCNVIFPISLADQFDFTDFVRENNFAVATVTWLKEMNFTNIETLLTLSNFFDEFEDKLEVPNTEKEKIRKSLRIFDVPTTIKEMDQSSPSRKKQTDEEAHMSPSGKYYLSFNVTY